MPFDPGGTCGWVGGALQGRSWVPGARAWGQRAWLSVGRLLLGRQTGSCLELRPRAVVVTGGGEGAGEGEGEPRGRNFSCCRGEDKSRKTPPHLERSRTQGPLSSILFIENGPPWGA